MDTVVVHYTNAGLVIDAGDSSVLISEKDIPLIKRGISRPLRTLDRQPIGSAAYAITRDGNLVVRIQKQEITLPRRVLSAAHDAIQRVIPTSPNMAVI